jgi:hypothetical protein
MTIRPAVFSILAVAGALSACVQPPVPAPTIQDACAAAVGSQAGVAASEVTIEETIGTAIGPKIYAHANGLNYACQGDLNGNIAGVELDT